MLWGPPPPRVRVAPSAVGTGSFPELVLPLCCVNCHFPCVGCSVPGSSCAAWEWELGHRDPQSA